MPKGLKITWMGVLCLVALSCGCSPVYLTSQRATATAYADVSMNKAMQAAEQSALTLCEIDFSFSQQTYIDAVCALSTVYGCKVFEKQIADSWETLEDTFSADRLACEQPRSMLVEEGVQFGQRIQVWRVELQGTIGWPQDQKERQYWLQISEQDGEWRLNRLVSSEEIAIYLALEIDGEML